MKHMYQNNYAAGRVQMYHKKSRELKAIRIIKTLLDYFGKRKIKNLKVLDIGASTGIIDNILAKSFKEVIGTDIDKDAVKFAQENFKRKNLRFKVDDAMKLSFKDNSFDVVICTHVYEHVPNPNKLFKEIYRVLKPGGVDRKSTRLNSSHQIISYAVFCLKKKKIVCYNAHDKQSHRF